MNDTGDSPLNDIGDASPDDTGDSPLDDSGDSPPIDLEFIESLVVHPERHVGLKLIKTKRRRGTVRSVFVYQDRLVIKQYAAYPWGRWWRAYWRGEHEALERLRGLPVPESYGYFALRTGAMRSKLLVRECLEGAPLTDAGDPVAAEFLPAIARLMAQVHRRGVIANDYSLYNIRRGRDGTIAFIDFHRGQCLPQSGVRYWTGLGKDLAHFYRVPCRRRMDLFEAFLASYFAESGVGDRERRLILAGCRLTCWLRFERGPGAIGA